MNEELVEKVADEWARHLSQYWERDGFVCGCGEVIYSTGPQSDGRSGLHRALRLHAARAVLAVVEADK